MSGNKPVVVITVAIVSIIVGISLITLFNDESTEFQLVPKERRVIESRETSGTEVGTGWSLKEDPYEAVLEAAGMALSGKKDKTPDFALIFASSGSDMKTILSKVRELFGPEAKLYGGTSDSRAVMTNKGFVNVTERGYQVMKGTTGLTIMTVSSEDIVFGVGSADFSLYPTVQEASKSAIQMAMRSSGKSLDEVPQVVLLTPTLGVEEEVIEGIEEIVGNQTPFLGGTAGGPTFGVIGENGVYRQGVSVAAIYTDLPIGWQFEGGFDLVDKQTGIVTKVDGQAILEIDNRPALDVYDEWLDGKIQHLFDQHYEPGVIRDLLTLHPLYRKYSGPNGEDYFLFSHTWPKDETLNDRSIMTSTKITSGERVYLSHGTWDKLINRIGNLPKKAKIKGGMNIDERPILGIGYICAGVMGVIPEKERMKMPFLLNYTINGAPFIATFSWGEQGHLPGISNKHGNLLTSFLVIGGRGDN